MAKKESKQSMTLEEAKAYRASLYVPRKRKLSEIEKKEKFRLFWTQSRKKYGMPKGIEEALWVHLKATGHDEPEKFEAGVSHFGLKKIS